MEGNDAAVVQLGESLGLAGGEAGRFADEAEDFKLREKRGEFIARRRMEEKCGSVHESVRRHSLLEMVRGIESGERVV